MGIIDRIKEVASTVVDKIKEEASARPEAAGRPAQLDPSARRNTRGLPLGMSRRSFDQAFARTASYPTRIVRLGKDDVQVPVSRTRQQEIVNTLHLLEENETARARQPRPSKIARRVAHRRHSSCSAMRSMLDIMDRREARAVEHK